MTTVPRMLKPTAMIVVAVSTLLAASVKADTFRALEHGVAPRTVDELWAGYDPEAEPLNAEVIKQWEQDGVTLQIVRYEIAVVRGRRSMMAAIFGYPTGATGLPGLVQIHGGGQSAAVNAVLTNAKRGYACISINWGCNPLRGVEDYKGPNTDWGAVDATQHTHNDHYHSFQPDDRTVDSVVSPRNNNWFLLTVAVRRALTFLQRQPQVNGDALGVYGHSMGGNLTLYTAATDNRVKAAVVTSAGGLNDESDNLKNTPFSNAQYASRVRCPVLFVNPSDDFHGTILGVEETTQAVRSRDLRLSRPPELNHHSMPEFTVTGELWFDQFLKRATPLPKTPALTWKLGAGDAPMLTVEPDPARPCESVDVYYTQDSVANDPKSIPNAVNRFWYHVRGAKTKDKWQASLPVLSANNPLWAFVNVRYSLAAPVIGAGFYYQIYEAKNFSISSHLLTIPAQALQAAHVKPALKATRLIESFAPGWKDEWYTYNQSGEWPWHTHKLHGEQWVAPTGAGLAIDVRADHSNQLVIQLDGFAATARLNGGPDWQTVVFSPGDFHDIRGATLAGWKRFGELILADKVVLTFKGSSKGSPPQPVTLGGAWQGRPPTFRNLRWEAHGP